MSTVQIEEIQRDPIGYLSKVEAGETLVVLRAEKAVAEIKPVATAAKTPRPFGLCAGEFSIPDDFDSPLPDEILRQFERS